MTPAAEFDLAIQYINSHIPHDTNPKVGIILGTGLHQLEDAIEDPFALQYKNIPGFVDATVNSHSGELIFGTIEEVEVVVMNGRFHHYEGYTAYEIAFPVRVMGFLGIDYLIISNAAGGLNDGMTKSSLLAITDHINLLPDNPTTGPHYPAYGPRFTDMAEAYSKQLIHIAGDEMHNMGKVLWKGIYACVPGPSLETKAEYKFLRIIRADVVGMSTVPEVIAARQMSIKVLAISVITDLCYGDIEPVNIDDIIKAAADAEPTLTELVRRIIKEISLIQ